jgi:hypothetical protein
MNEIKETPMTKPFPPQLSVAEFIADKLAVSGKTPQQIAQECGFAHPNMITMIINSQMKLPITDIASLAKALNVNGASLLRQVMLEYCPASWEAVENIMHSTILTANELALIRAFREVTGGSTEHAIVIDQNAADSVTGPKGGDE